MPTSSEDDVRKPLLDRPISPSLNLGTSESLPAFEVSKSKRIVQITIAVIACLFAAGPVFGYAALKPVLISEGVYRQKCTKGELDDAVRVCKAQDLSLNFMFTVAAVTTNVGALFVGTILDRYGPRVAGLIGGLAIAAGTGHMAFARTLVYDGYLLGYALLALGGPFIFISSFQLSNAFPSLSGTILSLLTGAFDASSIIFYTYRVLYERSGGELSPKRFFAVFGIIPVLIIATQLTVMPRWGYKSTPELVQEVQDVEEALADEEEAGSGSDISETEARQRAVLRERRQSVVSEITELFGGVSTEEVVRKEEGKRERSGVWGVMHGKGAWEQIQSPWWILMASFVILQMIRINYFVATILTQYEYLLTYPLSLRLNNYFDLALPLGGLLSIPLVGLFLDSSSTPLILLTLVLSASLIGILGLLPSLPLAYLHITLFVIYRPFFYTTLSDYVAKVFGFETFGKVYGALMALSGVCNLAQSALDYVTKYRFGRDPRPVNWGLLVGAAVVGSGLVGFVRRRAGRVGGKVV